eukprot:9231101-Alexandrium_andersonii.AAC.1
MNTHTHGCLRAGITDYGRHDPRGAQHQTVRPPWLSAGQGRLGQGRACARWAGPGRDGWHQ